MKCIHFLFVMLLSAHQLVAQDTLYYDAHENEILDSATAHEFKVIHRDSLQEDRATENWFKIDGTPIESIEYFPYSEEVLDGETHRFHENGTLKEVTTFQNGKLNGEVKTYYANGQLRRHDFFKDQEFERGTCWDSTGTEIDHTDFLVYPEFPGGEDALFYYLSTNVQYPREAKVSGEHGIVYARFVVSKTGEIEECSIQEGVSESLDNEALRVIESMPNWKPGMRDGEPDRFKFNLPIQFAMHDSPLFPKKKKKKRKKSRNN